MDEVDIIKRFPADSQTGLEWAKSCTRDSSKKGGANWGKTTFLYRVGREYIVTKRTYLAQEIGRSVLAGNWGFCPAN